MEIRFKTSIIIFVISSYLAISQSKDLTSIIKANSYPIHLKNDEVIGKGANILLQEAGKSEIFMFGENHGVKEIALLSRLLYEELSKVKPRALVTEIGPATARETEELIRAGGFEKFMKEGVNLMSVPFFFLEQEVPLLYSVTNNFPDNTQTIWGLDQEFMAGAPIILKRLEKLATTKKEKEVLKKANRKDFFNPFMIGQGDGEILKELKSVFSTSLNQEAKRITEQLVKSYEIYKGNSGGRGRWSNETRETLMMRNFEWYVSNYLDSIPPLYFRFGGYHLHKGKSPTVEEALGLRIDKWARQHQWTTLNVFVDAVQGETLDPMFGSKTELPTSKLWKNSIFKKHLINDQVTLFDLRALKGHPETKDMSNRFRHMINGYDYMILLPNGEAQNYLPGNLITYAYGIPILTFALLIVIVLIYTIVKFIRRRRKRRNSL